MQNLFCIIHGKFAVACVFVRIVFNEGNVDAVGLFERIEVAEYHVGSDGAYVETAVTADDFVTLDFALYLTSAIENYGYLHKFSVTLFAKICNFGRIIFSIRY